MFKWRGLAPNIGNKPESKTFLPEFMQETLDAFRALAIYFGLPVLTAFFLLRHGGEPFRSLPHYYLLTLTVLIKRLHIFYLLHLVPALIVRYIFAKRLKKRWALAVAMLLSVVALLILFPAIPFPNFKTLKDVMIYASACPCLMAYFTLRINRVRFSGAFVLAVFMGLLCWGFLVGRNLP